MVSGDLGSLLLTLNIVQVHQSLNWESQVSPKHQIEWQVPTFSVQCWVVGIAKFSQVLKPSPLLLCR